MNACPESVNTVIIPSAVIPEDVISCPEFNGNFAVADADAVRIAEDIDCCNLKFCPKTAKTCIVAVNKAETCA